MFSRSHSWPSMKGDSNSDLLQQHSGTQEYRLTYTFFPSTLKYRGDPPATIFLDSLTPQQR